MGLARQLRWNKQIRPGECRSLAKSELGNVDVTIFCREECLSFQDEKILVSQQENVSPFQDRGGIEDIPLLELNRTGIFFLWAEDLLGLTVDES